MRVRDFGKGIPIEMLDNFENNGAQVGVGLAGIRERVMEFAGKSEIKSDGAGTTVIVTIPFARGGDGAPIQRPTRETPVPVD